MILWTGGFCLPSCCFCCFLLLFQFFVVQQGFFDVLLLVCLHRYVDRKNFQYMEMDTDSAYMTLSASLHLVVKPDIRSFLRELRRLVS